MPRARLLVLFCLAVWRAQGGVPDKTEAALLAEARLHPGDFGANSRMGEYYAARGKYLPAISYLEKALAINPHSDETAYDLALACLKAGKAQHAQEVLEQILQQTSKPELHNLLGAVFDAEGKPREAIRELETAARADPSEGNVFDLGDALLSHGAYSPALEIFGYGVSKYPQSARLRVGQGVAQYSLGQYAAAVQSLCAAVDLDPGDAKALEFLGRMYDVSPEMADEVTRRLAHFAELYPQSARANYYYALSLRKRAIQPGAPADSDRIEKLLKKSIQCDPSFADARYQLGLLYEDKGRIAAAVDEYEAAVRLRNSLTAAHYRLARLYLKLGKPALSQREFEVVRQLKSASSQESPK